MSYEQRIIIQFLHKEKVHPTQIHRRLAAQYGLETDSLQSVQHWCQLFDCGRQNLHNDPRSGRPPIDYLDVKIIACLVREPFSSAHSLAEALDMSPATVLSRLHHPLGMNHFHLRWVPHQLTDDLRQVRVAKCGELLRALAAIQRIHFRHIITGDESWFYLEYQHALQWSVARDEVFQRADPAIGTAKFMLTVIWGVNSFHLLDLMPRQCRFTSQYFMEHVMAPLVQTIFTQGSTRYTPRLNVHLDNCRIHFSKVTE
jgi:hypothetical protein